MAKIWFFNIPLHGHINPTLPLVREIAAQGDEVTYFAAPDFAEKIQAAGAIYRPYQAKEAFAQSRQVANAIHQGGLVAKATHAILPEVLTAVEAENPEVILFDMSAPWGNIASSRFDIPSVAIFPHLPFYWRMAFIDQQVFRKGLQNVKPGQGYWRQLRRETRKIMKDFQLRKPGDVNVLSSSAELNLVFSSRYFQPYADQFDDSYRYVGPIIDWQRPEPLLEMAKQPGQKLIYIAVGTLYRAKLEFFRICLEAFQETSHTVIMSIGRAVDPAELGTVPPNFTIGQHLPQLKILQEADLFITHGGMNSINESIMSEVPMIVIPNTIEQTINAARVEQLRAGLDAEASQLSVEMLKEMAAEILADVSYKEGVGAIRDSFQNAGGVKQAAAALQAFKSDKGLV